MFELLTPLVLISSVAIALSTGTLGCIVVWRRVAFFGDGLAHNATLGIALGLLLSIDSTISIALSGLLFAVLLLWLQRKELLSTDALLGLLAFFPLALGLVMISLQQVGHFDIHHYLFGNLRRITETNAILLVVLAIVVCTVFIRHWTQIVLASINQELAQAEGINTPFLQALIIVLLSMTVAVTIQIVGILMISALLLIPAATARLLTQSPAQMVKNAILISLISILGGLTLSKILRLNPGPLSVTVAGLLFSAVLIGVLVKRRFGNTSGGIPSVKTAPPTN